MLVDAGVDSLVYVHNLRDLEVYADARQGVRVLGGQVPRLSEEGDRLPHGLFHRLVEVFVYAGDDPGVLCLTPGVFEEWHVLLLEAVFFVEYYLESRGLRGLYRREAHLTIALRGVSVAGVQECAGHLYGIESRRTGGHETLDVQVAAVDVRRHGVDHLRSIRGHADDPHERFERHLYAFSGRKESDLAFVVELEQVAVVRFAV